MTLAFENVSVFAGSRRLIGPLSVAVQPGEILAVLGPSGCGKSSLLAWLCGALPAGLRGEGRVLLDGRDVTTLAPEERGIGILFQDDLLFPHLSVAGNLAFGLRPGPGGAARRAGVIAAALESVGLAGAGPRDPATLSGGERARVALLRTLLAEPAAVLLDEPFGRLDPASRDALRRLTFDLVRERRMPALLVSHDEGDVAAAGGPVIRIGEER